MIVKYLFYSCKSENVVKNGRTAFTSQPAPCKDDGVYKLVKLTAQCNGTGKAKILQAYQMHQSCAGYRVLPRLLAWKFRRLERDGTTPCASVPALGAQDALVLQVCNVA